MQGYHGQAINMTAVYVAIGIGIAIVAIALIRKLLTPTAAGVAFVALVLLACTMGYTGIIVVCVPFLLSAVIGRIGKPQRDSIAKELHHKHGTRDAVQILCNITPSAALATLSFTFGARSAFVGAIAAVAAGFVDSVASDVGVLSKKPPRSIINFRPQINGISGGVSALGTLSGLVAAFAVAGMTFIFEPFDVATFFIIVACSFGGMLVDSVLGATVQAKYECGVCGKLTENPYHCGTAAQRVGGLTFVSNDLVNLVSNLLAGIAAALFALLI